MFLQSIYELIMWNFLCFSSLEADILSMIAPTVLTLYDNWTLQTIIKMIETINSGLLCGVISPYPTVNIVTVE